MTDDLDWTQALGEAVIAQQPDVLQAIQIFRRKAQDAGNLKTDDKQVVVEQEDAVKIVPAKQEVVYVPQYQPSAAVVSSKRRRPSPIRQRPIRATMFLARRPRRQRPVMWLALRRPTG